MRVPPNRRLRNMTDRAKELLLGVPPNRRLRK